MASRTRPYEQFGPFILFKKLETDALSDLWRAGRIDGDKLAGLVALRRLTGGNREALAQNAAEARNVAPLLTGTSFVKNQAIDVVESVPVIWHDYGGGRSLRHIVDRARGGSGVSTNPIPIDQAIVIAEKIALSLATTVEQRYAGSRLTHGALIPQFVWISDDGEIRVAGQHLGKGMVASLRDAKVAAEIARYFSPECQSSGDAAKASDVYSMGAVFFLLTTGSEPPDAVDGSAFAQTIRASKTMTGQPIPDDVRTILEKSLALDPAARFASIGDMKQALSALAHSGKYSATTFNLAFYLSSLLKKEMEGEGIDREKESKVSLTPYLFPPVPAPTFAAVTQPQRKARLPLYIAAAVLVAAIGAGGVVMTMKSGATQAASAPTPAPIRPRPKIEPPPVLAASASTTTTTSAPAVDSAAEKKAFEDAVNQKLQEEMMKLQAQFNKNLQQQRAKNAPVATESIAAPVTPRSVQVAEDRPPSAAALDERRLASRPEPAAVLPTVAITSTTTQPQVQPQQPPPAPVPAPAPAQVPAVREGDVVDFTDLDSAPRPLAPPRPIYPAMAMRQRIQATIFVTALVSENGDVIDVKVLQGDPRFGLNDAAVRAMRITKFTVPMKDGKRVRTWFPQTINFRMGS
jgi:TonB family protein